MKKAFGYLRLSKWDDATTSPQRQRRAIRKWCADHDVVLEDIFEDLDVSAYKRRARRPGLDWMLARLGEVDVVVAMRLDRLARSVSGFQKLLDEFEAAGVSFVTTDGTLDLTTAQGRAMAQMTSVFAELESATTAERALGMHAYKRENGEWVGRVPYGFRLNGKGLEVEPEEMGVLAECAREYIAGGSLRSIAAARGLHHPNVARQLRSDRVHDALPPEVAGPLARELAERGRVGGRAKASLLGGIARCAICGGGMTVVGQRSGWAAYSCRERGHVSISQPWLDKTVTDAVVGAIDSGEVIKRLKKRSRPRTLASSEIEARLELLERDFYELGSMPRDRYLARREGVLRKLEAARKAEAEVGIDLPRELALHLGERWPELSVQGRRRIISAVLSGIAVDRAASHGKIDPSRVRLTWR